MWRQPGLVVCDGLFACPYVSGRMARMPFEWHGSHVNGSDLDSMLALGYRRCGPYFYRLSCPQCTSCHAIRIPLRDFQPSATQRRVWRRGQARFRVEMTMPTADSDRLHLFNRHRLERRLDDEPTTWQEFETFLIDTACPTREIDYRVGDRLVAVAITDVGCQSWSAVYCYFDPEESRYSPGVFSILAQIDMARKAGASYLYLGLYSPEAAHLRYKAQYCPHELLLGGRWESFSRATSHTPSSYPGHERGRHV